MRNDGTKVGRRSKEEYCRAETACRKAISLAPHDAEAFLLLGTILAGETYNELRYDDSAVEAIKTAIELKPGWADAYCALARACDLLKRYEEAAAAYTEEARLRNEKQFEHGRSSIIIQSEKDHSVVDAFVVAQIYTKLGKYDKALTSLQRAATLSPEDDVIHSWIGRTFLNLGDIESAKREQKLLSELCKSKNEFFIAQCQARAQDLLKAIDQKAK
ncbi:MAG: tetratricopeptide repeat protein [Acidobacteriota bacterium]